MVWEFNRHAPISKLSDCGPGDSRQESVYILIKITMTQTALSPRSSLHFNTFQNKVLGDSTEVLNENVFCVLKVLTNNSLFNNNNLRKKDDCHLQMSGGDSSVLTGTLQQGMF